MDWGYLADVATVLGVAMIIVSPILLFIHKAITRSIFEKMQKLHQESRDDIEELKSDMKYIRRDFLRIEARIDKFFNGTNPNSRRDT
ncbi:hypothetical protein L0152_07175 [bacterium]|nr:hypothetical protein [bacterium]